MEPTNLRVHWLPGAFSLSRRQRCEADQSSQSSAEARDYWFYTSVCIKRGTNPRLQVAVEAEVFTVVPNIYGVARTELAAHHSYCLKFGAAAKFLENVFSPTSIFFAFGACFII